MSPGIAVACFATAASILTGWGLLLYLYGLTGEVVALAAGNIPLAERVDKAARWVGVLTAVMGTVAGLGWVTALALLFGGGG